MVGVCCLLIVCVMCVVCCLWFVVCCFLFVVCCLVVGRLVFGDMVFGRSGFGVACLFCGVRFAVFVLRCRLLFVD